MRETDKAVVQGDQDLRVHLGNQEALVRSNPGSTQAQNTVDAGT